METREILEKSKELQKASAAGAAAEDIVRILDELKTGVSATENVLRSTKIGVIVNRSKAHKDTRVARLAGEIVKKWRDDIERQKSSGNAAAKPGEKRASNGSTPAVPLDQRNFTKDKVDLNRTGQETRDRCIGLLYNGLCYDSPDAASRILEVAIAVEAAGCDIVGPETNDSYNLKMRSLYMNLKNKSNPKLRRDVLDGVILPEQLIKMSSEDLKSDERRKADSKLIQENLKDAQMPQVERSISTAIQCSNPKCGKGTVAYTQAQTRSADEPMTTFCECKLESRFHLFFCCISSWHFDLPSLMATRKVILLRGQNTHENNFSDTSHFV